MAAKRGRQVTRPLLLVVLFVAAFYLTYLGSAPLFEHTPTSSSSSKPRTEVEILLEDIGSKDRLQGTREAILSFKEVRQSPSEDKSWHVEPHADYAGEAVQWGVNHLKNSPEECQKACEDAMVNPPPNKPECNVFVYCSNPAGCGFFKYQECWLKHAALPERREAMTRGPSVPWTSGAWYSDADVARDEERLLLKLQDNLIARLEQMLKGQEGPVSRDYDNMKRECGSPSTDAYAHVDVNCLERSSTARAWAFQMLRSLSQQEPGQLRDIARAAAHAQGLPPPPIAEEAETDGQCLQSDKADLDGIAVVWGTTNKKPSAAACCEACRRHVPGLLGRGPFKNLPCNTWAWCSQQTCFETDAHKHTFGDCWLKFQEIPWQPEVNMRGRFTDEYRQRHPNAPEEVQWIAGVIVPEGAELTNGTWAPRSVW